MTRDRDDGRATATTAIAAVQDAAQPLSGADEDLDELVRRTRGKRFVLLGEASHGTHEFYDVRAQLTRRLVAEEGFDAVAVEADWPDAWRVDGHVRGGGRDRTAEEALSDFQRFPRWMWRNADVARFVDWLRAHNRGRDAAARVGFYGVDLYSLHSSVRAVIEYLEGLAPHLAAAARRRYGCFDHVGPEPQAYGWGVRVGSRPSCEREVVEQLLELQRARAALLSRDGLRAEDEQFQAEQNARVVRNAEDYYRMMFSGGRDETWNLRDQHMTETIAGLDAHRSRQLGRPARIVVWEHNSHLGDARATEMAQRGEWNVGQLVRERYGDAVLNVGFTTCHGTVAAADDWDGPVRRKRVRPALPGSYEALFHESGLERFLLLLDDPTVRRALAGPRLERAIGVIYRPQTERASHWFLCRLPEQFDAVIHIDESSAVEPLDTVAGWATADAAETWPFGV